MSWTLASLGAALTVTSLNDNGTGTLRARIAEAAPGDTINFSVVGTITLYSQLGLSKNLTINGPGASLLKVSGNNTNRVFNIANGKTQISDLTIANGRVVGANGAAGFAGESVYGAGIFIASGAALDLQNCIVSNNAATGGQGGPPPRFPLVGGPGGHAYGGGIAALGSLTMAGCRLVANGASGGPDAPYLGGARGGNASGGALYLAGTGAVFSSTFHANSARGGYAIGMLGTGLGGGIFNTGRLNLIASTISSGYAFGATSYGGGLYNGSDAALLSCTIASNRTSCYCVGTNAFGGGIYNVGTLGSTNCTVAGNEADDGGGLHGNVTAGGTIFGPNTADNGPDVSGTIDSLDYNLLQSPTGANLTGATTHCIIGQDPRLAQLQNNGGPTLTMALLSDSPAIDQSSSFGAFADQRGVVRPRDLPAAGNASGGDGSDIGAFELIPAPDLNIHFVNETNIVLFWSTNSADFTLQWVSSLFASNNWSDVSSARVFMGNQVYVTNVIAGEAKFYRLSLPEAQPPPP